jgi:hypothetical protein
MIRVHQGATMMLRAKVGLVGWCCLALMACKGGEAPEQQPAPAQPVAAPAAAAPAAPAVAPEPAKAPEVPVAEICTQTVTAAKANDEAKLAALVAGGLEQLAADGIKEPLIKHLAGSACGQDKVDGDKAIVALTQGQGKKAKTQEAPFIKTAEGGWKLDAASYLSKYPMKAVKAKNAGKKPKGKKK